MGRGGGRRVCFTSGPHDTLTSPPPRPMHDGLRCVGAGVFFLAGVSPRDAVEPTAFGVGLGGGGWRWRRTCPGVAR